MPQILKNFDLWQNVYTNAGRRHIERLLKEKDILLGSDHSNKGNSGSGNGGIFAYFVVSLKDYRDSLAKKHSDIDQKRQEKYIRGNRFL